MQHYDQSLNANYRLKDGWCSFTIKYIGTQSKLCKRQTVQVIWAKLVGCTIAVVLPLWQSV